MSFSRGTLLYILQKEVERTLARVSCKEDYETACRVRSYASAMEKAHSDQDLSEWIAWPWRKHGYWGRYLCKKKHNTFTANSYVADEKHNKNEKKRKMYCKVSCVSSLLIPFCVVT